MEETELKDCIEQLMSIWETLRVDQKKPFGNEIKRIWAELGGRKFHENYRAYKTLHEMGDCDWSNDEFRMLGYGLADVTQRTMPRWAKRTMTGFWYWMEQNWEAFEPHIRNVLREGPARDEEGGESKGEFEFSPDTDETD
jgi:hypothetical protein